jgi:hypothetical protein
MSSPSPTTLTRRSQLIGKTQLAYLIEVKISCFVHFTKIHDLCEFLLVSVGGRVNEGS